MRGVLVKPVAGEGGRGFMNEIYLLLKSYFEVKIYFSWNKSYSRMKESYFRSKQLILLLQVMFSNENIILPKQVIDFLVQSHVFERKYHLFETNT